MDAIYWYLIIGTTLLGVAVAASLLKHLPVSTAIIYLLLGLALGPHGLGLLSWDVVNHAHLFERLSEVAVIVSLFTVGLNLRRSLGYRAWLLPVRLASVSMAITIAAIALVGGALLGLPLGAAVLLGAILAPTDPVLASDVQIKGVTDRDRLRYSLSAEAGLNDGSAFPFVMLGLGLLGLHPRAGAGFAGLWTADGLTIGAWLAWDLLWAVTAGLLVGAACGWLVGRFIARVRSRQAETFGMQAFVVLGLIALAYGLAELVYGYGFLAVFAAGYAVRYLELQASQHADAPPELPAVAPDQSEAETLEAIKTPEAAAHYLAVSLSQFNTQLEHLLQAVVVVLLGGVLTTRYLTWDLLWFAPLLFGLLRPLAVLVGMWRSASGPVQRTLMGWFGIRGIGSIYYLTYALGHGFAGPLAERISGLVLTTVAVSIVVHGISVTPLMHWYESLVERRRAAPAPAREDGKV
jgi:NhaP-type Na+/H+ or K+/H+ antiporter